MDAFCERLLVRAATIDELLSDDFEALPGQNGDAELAARRLAAWCRASASGDWSLFGGGWRATAGRRPRSLPRFAGVRRKPSAAPPAWLDDAIWIEAALQGPAARRRAARAGGALRLRAPVRAAGRAAETRLWAGSRRRRRRQSERTRARRPAPCPAAGNCPTLPRPRSTKRFVQARKAAGIAPDPDKPGSALYDRFVADMKAGGWRALFEEKPVLLRLIAVVTRQWIDTTREFVLRLDADLRGDPPRHSRVRAAAAASSRIEGDFSDPHNNGRSVKIVSFEDGARVVYKPKDLRLDAAWHALVERLNAASPPLDLKAVRALARDGYGWTEFIDHAACAGRGRLRAFFPPRRRLARAVALLRRQRHASGEHDRLRRSAGADRSGNDPAGRAPSSADAGCGRRGLSTRPRPSSPIRS